MKKKGSNLQTIILMLVVFAIQLPGQEDKARVSEFAASSKLTGDYDLKEEFDSRKLRDLSEKSSRTRSENRHLMLLILHAGIEKDESFQYLLKKPELKEVMNVRLALAGYDYLLNQSGSSLDHILAQIATEGVGADVDSIVVLSTLDEWDRSIRAFRKHFIRSDGAGAACMNGFRLTRAYLYPKKYQEYREVIEAPISYGRLMPKQDRQH